MTKSGVVRSRAVGTGQKGEVGPQAVGTGQKEEIWEMTKSGVVGDFTKICKKLKDQKKQKISSL